MLECAHEMPSWNIKNIDCYCLPVNKTFNVKSQFDHFQPAVGTGTKETFILKLYLL